MNPDWYARPVLFVANVDRTLDFYVDNLGFTRGWRFEDGGKTLCGQADRQGCALIFSCQWPDKVGKGLMFISLSVDAPPDRLRADETAALDNLRREFEAKGVQVEDGMWGYRLLVVRDPDGNELYFNYPADEQTPPE